VESLKLASKLDASAKEIGKSLDVLLEVNIGNEAAKAGLSADLSDPEWNNLLQGLPAFANLRVGGLMCIPPHTNDPNGARPYFQKMRVLREQIVAMKLPKIEMTTLSMGMSHDFEVAIGEGSTRVRLGTAIFGGREEA